MGNLSHEIMTLELAALERWNNGDPDGYLALYDEDITYIDPEQRIEGRENMVRYYEAVRGKVFVESYELQNPVVQPLGEGAAVLSFNLISRAGDRQWPWNCTEVYRRKPDGRWKIAHNHWSLMKQPG